MKKIVCLALSLLLILGVPCLAEGKTRVLASIFPVYDIARQVAGENAEVSMLVRCGAEEHGYEPTPADIIAIEECDVFLYIGGESDEWIEDILSSIDLTGKTVVRLMDCTDTMLEAGGEEDEYDEHIWTSPVKAMDMARAIAQALGTDADAYVAELEALDGAIRETVSTAKRKEILFGDRFPLLYFAEEYGLTWRAAFPGCSEETEPDAATMADLIDAMREDKLPVVFHIEMGNERVANAIAQETGAQVLQYHSCHNVTKEEFDGGITYIELMYRNLKALKIALN
ncbi:MAG: metal ABC transporter substrate-binding protein [Christensenellales bacterium]|jgi:zinc transport system substrate-binding protein